MDRRIRLIITLTLVVGLLAPTQVLAEEPPPLVNWGEVIPGFTPGLDTSDSNICTRGADRCVQSVLRKMSRQFNRLARQCDHNAIFQLGYMRTTEAYYESSQIPGFYDDVPWMHHYDAVFADYYLGPQRAWANNRVSDVPPVWREAFAAADAQELSSTGNFLMGMNAHINRDLPFVLDDIGLTDEYGDSRKPDHERVNEFLNNVADDLSPEMVARFDPTWDTNPEDDTLSGFAVQQVIQEWRERAWNAAWLMTYSPEPVADLVAQGIESGSAELAGLIREATTVSDAERDARNAYCSVNYDNWDGGDGTYFDGVEDDQFDAPSFDPPNPTDDLAALAALGVHVDVSLEFGVSITLDHGLLGLLGPL